MANVRQVNNYAHNSMLNLNTILIDLMLGLEISTGNLVSHVDERMRITSMYRIGYRPSYTSEVNKKTTKEGKSVL